MKMRGVPSALCWPRPVIARTTLRAAHQQAGNWGELGNKDCGWLHGRGTTLRAAGKSKKGDEVGKQQHMRPKRLHGRGQAAVLEAHSRADPRRAVGAVLAMAGDGAHHLAC